MTVYNAGVLVLVVIIRGRLAADGGFGLWIISLCSGGEIADLVQDHCKLSGGWGSGGRRVSARA